MLCGRFVRYGRSATIALAIAAAAATAWCGPTSAQGAPPTACAALGAQLTLAAKAKHDVGEALAAQTKLDDSPAFDSLQHALDAAAPLLSHCDDPGSASRYAALEFARVRLLFDDLPALPTPDPTCATVPSNPTTVDERRKVAQCEYSSQVRELAAIEIYQGRKTFFSQLQIQFDTLSKNGFERTAPGEYAADRDFLASAEKTLAASAAALPSPEPSPH